MLGAMYGAGRLSNPTLGYYLSGSIYRFSLKRVKGWKGPASAAQEYVHTTLYHPRDESWFLSDFLRITPSNGLHDMGLRSTALLV